MQDTNQDWTQDRLAMALVGAAGGGSTWWLAEKLPDYLPNDRLTMLITLTVLGFYLVLMALSGPVRMRRAAGPALAMAAGIAALFYAASFRFPTAGGFITPGHPVAALSLIYLIATPFVLVMLAEGRAGWRDYGALFQTTWTIIVRFLAASLFTGVVWGVLFLSDALLNLVGIDVIEQIIDYDPAPFVITGGVMGLALSVAHEWRDYVSPHLLLRLLRLLVPMVVPVLAIFLLAVAMTGLEQVLGFVSETALLTGVAIGCITLITVSVDRDPAHQVQSRLLRWGVKAVAVMLVPLAGLAVWGIWVRVAQYGWTPERLWAALAVGMVMLYGLAYAPLALWPGDWGRRLRGVNIGLALLALAIAVLWLTPVLNAERISTRSQLARILDGRVKPEHAALWEMAHSWGKAGTAAVARLREQAEYPERDTVLALLEKAEKGSSRYAYQRDSQGQTAEERGARLAALMPVMPTGTTLPEGAFEDLPEWMVNEAIEACQRTYDDGKPGCVYLEVTFNPALSERQGIILLRENGLRVSGYDYMLSKGKLERHGRVQDLMRGKSVKMPPETIPLLLDGQFRIAPAQLNVLEIGGMSLFPDN